MGLRFIPASPASTTRLHVSFPDPSGHGMEEWREVRDAIGDASRELILALTEGRTPTWWSRVPPWRMSPRA